MNSEGKLVAMDISDVMCKRAEAQRSLVIELEVEVLTEDILQNKLPDQCADCVISSFGIKTFSEAQFQIVAEQIYRILKPGGHFAMIEISVPEFALMRWPYMFYLKHCIPLIGKLLMGNPDNYRMLGVYTQNFKDCRQMEQQLKKVNLCVQYRSLFFGCASALCGSKPE